MKILVNTASLRSGGGLQVALSLLEEFSALEQHQFEVLLSPQLADLISGEGAPHIRLHRLPVNPAQSLRRMRHFQRLAAGVEADFRPDAALTVFGPAWWKPAAPHLVGFANGIFLFNKSRFIRQVWPKGRLRRMKYAAGRKLVLRQLRREASALWVETETAKSALAEALPGKPVYVVGNAVSAGLLRSVALPTEPAGTFRLLTLCAAHPNKNLELIRALLPLFEDEAVQFQVTLPQQDFERLFPLKSSRICNLGPVHPAQLAAAYAGCDAVFLPSWLETFSASYPEAMLAGKPILASDLPFAHEICGNAALYFDPGNADAAAAAVRKLVREPALRQQLIAAGRQRLGGFISAAGRAAALLEILAAIGKPAPTVS